VRVIFRIRGLEMEDRLSTALILGRSDTYERAAHRFVLL
jgi:hypothetical protein